MSVHVPVGGALVGGDPQVLQRCTPVFRSFSTHVVHSGPTGARQLAKLFHNALLMINQAGIADVVELATQAGMEVRRQCDAEIADNVGRRAHLGEEGQTRTVRPLKGSGRTV